MFVLGTSGLAVTVDKPLTASQGHSVFLFTDVRCDIVLKRQMTT